MGQALYRKYRSKTLDEVVGQDHITTTLKNALKTGKISHAYLFTGPRGVGKTSVARIIAHAVNKLTYTDDQPHLDIIEIDAASNRRIDEIRELRERVRSAPAAAAYKVYIIDEVHMLTREAVNALLKTLEEPPAHAIFILATTEAHKLPETIISRTQRFSFRPIDAQVVVKHLIKIAQAEKITITDDALRLIAEHGNGSFRDSISLLDQSANLGKSVNRSDIERLLGIVPEKSLQQLVSACLAGDSAGLLDTYTQLLESGATPAQLAKQINQQLRPVLLSATDGQATISQLIHQLIDVPASHDPEVALEVALVEAALAITPNLAIPAHKKIQPLVASQPQPQAVVQSLPLAARPAAIKTVASSTSQQIWPQLLTEIKKHHATLYSIARMAKTRLQGTEITMEFSFPFHQKRLTEAKNKQIVIDTLKQLTGQTFTLNAVLRSTQNGQAVRSSGPPTDSLNTISNIFGTAEVLES